jgi:hypothetical protein
VSRIQNRIPRIKISMKCSITLVLFAALSASTSAFSAQNSNTVLVPFVTQFDLANFCAGAGIEGRHSHKQKFGMRTVSGREEFVYTTSGYFANVNERAEFSGCETKYFAAVLGAGNAQLEEIDKEKYLAISKSIKRLKAQPDANGSTQVGPKRFDSCVLPITWTQIGKKYYAFITSQPATIAYIAEDEDGRKQTGCYIWGGSGIAAKSVMSRQFSWAALENNSVFVMPEFTYHEASMHSVVFSKLDVVNCATDKNTGSTHFLLEYGFFQNELLGELGKLRERESRHDEKVPLSFAESVNISAAYSKIFEDIKSEECRP